MGAANWAFLQLALVFWLFQAIAIFVLVTTNTWVHDPPSFMMVLNPLYKAYGAQHMLVPAWFMQSYAKSQLYRSAANVGVWSLIQWGGAAAILDIMRAKSRG
jgi:hypothetical protein